MKHLALLTITAVVCLATAGSIQAAEWHGIVGAQSDDKGAQALAFLPNEFWVRAGDSITWTFETDEKHTVSFLTNGQIRPAYQAGCPPAPPGTTPDGSSFNGTACVNSGVLPTGQTYTVNFPSTGVFKLVCLVHANMTATIHVLDVGETLPHDQSFYDHEAEIRRAQLLADGARLKGRGATTAEETAGNTVGAGIGEIIATPGGNDTMAIMRFQRDKIIVHVGDTVEWTNLDPVSSHTVNFGAEPANDMPPSPGVSQDVDGALHAVIMSLGDSVNSGFLNAARQDRAGFAQTPAWQAKPGQTPAGVTRFRATFTSPGVFHYRCTLHDELGMVGTVIVLP